MVIATGLDNNASCHILDHLQLIKQFIRNTIQKAHSRNQVDIAQGNESGVQSHVGTTRCSDDHKHLCLIVIQLKPIMIQPCF